MLTFKFTRQVVTLVSRLADLPSTLATEKVTVYVYMGVALADLFTSLLSSR